MKILIHFGHPAHVHLFKNFIFEMKSKGNEFIFTHTDKDVVEKLLSYYEFDSVRISKTAFSITEKVGKLLASTKSHYLICLKEKPDLMIGVAASFLTYVGKILDIKTIVVDDTDHSHLEIFLYKYTASLILTPESFDKHLGTNHLNYKGTHELSYLCSDYFRPQNNIFDYLDIDPKVPFIMVRLVNTFSAIHDKNLQIKDNVHLFRNQLIRKLAKKYKIFISSELPLPPDIQDFAIKIPPYKIHDALYFASLFLTESTTMGMEASILGTPSVLIYPKDTLGVVNFILKYGLMERHDSWSNIDYSHLEKLIGKDKEYWVEKCMKIENENSNLTAYLLNYCEEINLNKNHG